MSTKINTTKKITARLAIAGLSLGAVFGLGFTQASSAGATTIIRSKSNITNNRLAGGQGGPAPVGIRRYPPNGYPCLGCHPCPPDFCDNDNNMVVWHDPTGGTLVAWFAAHATA